MNSLSVDESMLELFLLELDTHTKALEQGIVEIEKEQTPQKIEPLMRAAHSIKGSARIMGFDSLVGLAHKMEDILTKAQSGILALNQSIIDALLAANDLFSDLKTVPAGQIADTVAGMDARLVLLLKNLDDSLNTETAAPPKIQTQPEPKPDKEPTTAPVQSIDPFMLDLFKIELENHTKSLEQGLMQAEQNQNRESIEPLMRAAHSIKGAARIIGLQNAVELAHSMEDMLQSAMNGTFMLEASDIDLLLEGNDFYKDLGAADINDIAGIVEQKLDYVNSLEKRILAALSGEKSPITAEVQAQVIPSVAQAAELKEKPIDTADNQFEIADIKAEQSQKTSTTADKSKQTDTFVRVLSESLNRIIGLSGETLVLSKSTRAIGNALQKMKNIGMEINSKLETIRDRTGANTFGSLDSQAIGDALELSNNLSHALANQIDTFEQFSRRLDNLTDQLYRELIESRMRPFSDGLHGFQRMVRDLAKSLGKKVNFEVKGGMTRVDRDILEKLEAPLTHIIRNCVDHGIEMPESRLAAGKPETGTITIEARHSFGMLIISISDDGRGIDEDILRAKIIEKGYVTVEMAESIKGAELFEFLFLPGFSTAKQITEISGRGVGLDVAMSMAQEVGGSIRIDSQKGTGTTFTCQLPITLSVQSSLLVEICGEKYALPLTRIDRILQLQQEEISVLENKQYCTIGGENIGIISAAQALALPEASIQNGEFNIILISDRLNKYGICVDKFIGKFDLSVKPLDTRLGKIQNISAGSILDDGSPVVILDVDDLVRTIDSILTQGSLRRIGSHKNIAIAEKKRILVVDDSITVREVERKLLENRGYHVSVAVDGIDGWNSLQSASFDLVISDIDMPRMNGIEFVTRLKQHPEFKGIPVMIVSYKDREEDRIRGLEAGANYYLTKSSFHDESLINAVKDLIGEA
jgi:two-component system sensor histidine kinase and response regulator WspE